MRGRIAFAMRDPSEARSGAKVPYPPNTRVR